MKEITRIHLAATAFNIEVEARRELEKYLTGIEKSLQADEDALREIEARIVELLAERQVTGEKTITRTDVEAIRRQLGEPGEFVDEQAAEETIETAGGSRRLFRDQERGLIGGVLAGIAARFGVNPLWLRIAAIFLLFISFGTVVLVYIVLWIAVPVATSAADKLQMVGKPVTLAAIKNQSDISAYINSSKKPFVVVLRSLLGAGFFSVALASLVGVGAVVFGVFPHVQSGEQSWSSFLFVALILAAVSGMLFAILMGLASYASFVWKLNKTIGISAIVIVIAGLACFGSAIAFGYYESEARDRHVASITRTEKIDLSEQLRDVTHLVGGTEAASITYEVTNESPRAEMTIVSENAKQPTMRIDRDGTVARIHIDKEAASRCEDWSMRCNDSLEVKIYGPELTGIDAKKGTIVYDAMNQAGLQVNVGRDAAIDIQRGSITTLAAELGEDSRLNTQRATITDANIKTNAGARMQFGILSNLSVDTPSVCPAASPVDVTVTRTGTLTRSGELLNQNDEIDDGCVRINVQEPLLSNKE